MRRLTVSEIRPLLFEASPSFRDAWEEYLLYWREEGETFWDADVHSLVDDQDSRGFNEMFAFAKYLLSCLRDGETNTFPTIFQEIERILIGGSDEVRVYITIGLFEDLQGLPDGESVASDEFLQWLGPVSWAGWFGAIAQRQGRGDVLDIVQNAVERHTRALEDRPNEP